ncbi:MAG: PQQ-dependent sugar dehydrogenase, partial [Pseudanabaenaceae cyanobacterium]
MKGWWAVPVVVGLAIAPPAGGQGYRVETVLTGLERPWGMAWLPDGTLLVTERPGRLRVIREGKLDPVPVAGVPPVLAAGQGGLLDITVHPNFASNRLIYLSYASGTAQRNRLQVARGVWDGRNLRNLRVILETSPWKPGTQHFGSRFTWLPDRTLLLSVGDGGNPPVTLAGDWIRMQAQNGASHLGKVLRLRDDGSVPADNPFAYRGSFDAKVWSLGHRNIQGKAIDPQTNVVWATEHGSRGGDELNRLA